jgi:capsular exopolysaccharide synthesis family protein
MRAQQQVRPADYVVQHPTSAYAEAIRTVRTAVLLNQKSGGSTKTVLVTSSMPAEGKTSFVLSFARVSAMSGQKILVIDCDTRRPTVHKGLGLQNKHGIIDVLLGAKKLAEVVQKDRRSTVQVIAAGKSVPNPADLLASDKMKALLTHLRTQYDLIIIDSPPTLAVSDARVLSELVDKTVFISRWAETARDVAQMATRQLVQNGANMAGVLLTRVNVQKNARYGYADSGYYGRKYTKYYGTAN